ncbi:hypothetical protein HMPREF1020_03478 [Clostridium sp. 7_3_54FAA]|nr:hypothetical protein HMPREF1020_03478 [Clostridium sp. 7_3_54FAA]
MGSRFDFYIPSSDGLSRIHGIHWLPDSDAAAVIQISHGMLEHAGRYGAFAEAMNAKGIAVIGHDHLGHGKTARPGCLGTFSDWTGPFMCWKTSGAYQILQSASILLFLISYSVTVWDPFL